MRLLSEFQDAVDRETGWRKRELTTILFDVQSSRATKQATAIRGGIALLYAHWEGWVKRIAEIYIDHVESQKLKYEELSSPFFALALQVQMNNLVSSGQSTAHIQFADFLREDLAGRARFGSRRTVQTESNLSSTVLFRVLAAIGLAEQLDNYQASANLIDQQLVKRRNKVAHGEYLDIEAEDFATLHANISTLLREFTCDVTNCAALRRYQM